MRLLTSEALKSHVVVLLFVMPFSLVLENVPLPSAIKYVLSKVSHKSAKLYSVRNPIITA
jgi:hypothetical protein